VWKGVVVCVEGVCGRGMWCVEGWCGVCGRAVWCVWKGGVMCGCDVRGRVVCGRTVWGVEG